MFENPQHPERADFDDEDYRVFLAYCREHRIKISDLSDDDLRRLYAEALSQRDAYPIPISDPAYLYHGTAKNNLPSIAEHGLRSSAREKKWRNPELTAHSDGKVFFTQTIRSAMFYAIRASKNNVICRVARADLQDARPDEKDEEALFVERVVPPDEVEFWNGREWKSV